VPDGAWTTADAIKQAPVQADWQQVTGMVRHTFTHFLLELTVLAARIDDTSGLAGVWCPPDRFGDYALPTVMKKVVRLGVGFDPAA